MTTPQPGDLVFCHGIGITSKAIRLGEWLRFRTGDFWSHVAIVDNDGTVIQAVPRGVTRGASINTLAPGGSYEVVRVTGIDVDRVIAFASSQVGKEYGYSSALSVALRILLPKRFPLPSFRSDRTWICSALGGEAIRYGGWLNDWPDVYNVTPAQLYAAIKGTDVRDVLLTSRAIQERNVRTK